MGISLNPILSEDLDPAIAANLEPGEVVLWQGAPEVRSLSNLFGRALAALGLILGILLLLGLGPLLVPGLALASGSTTVPGLVLVAFSGFFSWLGWQERDENWRFAITDRRLLIIRGGKLFRSALPGEIRTLRIRGNIVYWARSDTSSSEGKKNSGRYIGFRGMRHPEEMKGTLEAWRESFSQRAEETAAAFTEASTSADPTSPDITRVLHPETGLHIDVPSSWQIMVDDAYDGPLQVFGITILPRIIRSGGERAYGDGKPWTVLKVRGAPDAGLYMTVRNAPLTQTLEAVENDPWAERFGLEVLQTTPDLEIGPFKGFSIVRKMQGGSVLTGFGRVESPVATRMVWLGSGKRSIELTGMARLDMEDVQYAIDAMVNSLGYQ
ncbi:hypothetical protein [Marivita geojedonensis]|uniref:Uncharacterized protein n=1 Tax=Marivita geojedonensis TaxID=1123756 RepID=A0A1X4N8C3_9RHOB|nr:hypothetical protein [Marivita geojedonensis]OSQ42470.1 hypothetical protein MGEO_20510 [Marivita geojedonensis]PRY71416.1 hypothetical protein CLV76_1433 [Marivita geojedonensis]